MDICTDAHVWKSIKPVGPHDDDGCGSRRTLDLVVPKRGDSYSRLVRIATQGPLMPIAEDRASPGLTCQVALPEGGSQAVGAASNFRSITPCIVRLDSCRAAVIGADVGAARTTACVTLGQALTRVVSIHVFDGKPASFGARLTLPVRSDVTAAGLQFADGCAQLFLVSDREVGVHFFGPLPEWASRLRDQEDKSTRFRRVLSGASPWPFIQHAAGPVVLALLAGLVWLPLASSSREGFV